MDNLFGDLTNQKRLSTTELLTEVAMFAYLSGNGVGKEGLQFLTGMKVATEVYKRFTEKDAIMDALRADATQKIVVYIQQNPRASPDQQAAAIKKYIDEFAANVALVEAMK